jgi:hypothetical protein
MDDISQEIWDTGRLLGYDNGSAANTETVQDPSHIHHEDMCHTYAGNKQALSYQWMQEIQVAEHYMLNHNRPTFKNQCLEVLGINN